MTPPHHLHAERAVIGSCILNNDALPSVMSVLGVDDFYHGAHRTLWEAMTSLYPSVDFVTLSAWLQNHNVLEEVGGVGALADLLDAAPSIANIEHYVEIVLDKSNRRRVIASCQQALTACSSDTDIEEVMGQIQRDCMAIVTSRKRGGPEKFSDVNLESLTELSRCVDDGISPGLKTGLRVLDENTGGFQKGDLIVLSARPSVGKSALACNIATNVARTGDLVLIFSLEMVKKQLWGRMLSRQSGVPFWFIRNAALDQHDMSRIVRASGDLDDLDLWIDETPGITPSQIEMRTQKVCLGLKKQPSLIVVDYLQIVRPDRKESTRDREVGSMSAAFKELAKRMDCPVNLLSQLNRESTKRKDPHPTISDLRESGAIEQDADVILALYRKGVTDPVFKNHAELGVLKQRNGPVGWLEDIEWDPNTVSFRDKDIRNPVPYQERGEEGVF